MILQQSKECIAFVTQSEDNEIFIPHSVV